MSEPPLRRIAKVTEAPPWLVWLATPLLARVVAQQLRKEHPELDADRLAAKMRADLGPSPEPGALRLVEAVRLRLPPPQRADAEAILAGPGWGSPSALVLLAANLVPLYGVLAWDWPVFPLFVLFWLENVVIGLLNAARMLLADVADVALWAAKLFMVPFFCLHFGAFCFGHGVFVFGFFGGKAYDVFAGGDPLAALLRALDEFQLWIPAAALAASHLFSFLWNYLWRGEFRRASLGELMGKPYGRVVVLHLTIIFGGIGTTLLGTPLWALLVLLALKIGIDLYAHLSEHRSLGRRS